MKKSLLTQQQGGGSKDDTTTKPKNYTVTVKIDNADTTGVTAESIKYIIGTDATKQPEKAEVNSEKVATIAVPAGEQVIIVFSGTGLDIEKDTQNKHKVEWKVNSVVAQDTDVKETKKTATPAVDAKSELTIKKVEAKKDVTVTVTKNS